MNHAMDSATAPGGTELAALQRAYSAGGLEGVLTSYRADLIRTSTWLRLGLLAVLALASALEHGGPLPLPAVAALAGYGLLTLATAAGRYRLGRPRKHTSFAGAMLWGDVVVVAVLALVSDGAPALALALFLVPMFAAFQLPVRRTAVIAVASLVTYLLLLAGDPRLRVRTVDENALAVLAFLVLTCLACLVVARQHQERAGWIRQLIWERGLLLAEVMCVEERERATLAELLHDGPLQSVLAVRLELGTARRLEGPEAVATARVRLLDISRQLRDLTAELHPLMLEAKGIGHILSLLTNTTAERAGLEGTCEVTVRHDTEQPDLREGLVFTAARELLNNVVLHAKATRFHVSLMDDTGVWRLEVRDDGRGIAPDEPRSKLLNGHIGLASLRIRIEAVRGTMAILSGSEGTTVVITLPALGQDFGFPGQVPPSSDPVRGRWLRRFRSRLA
ncbi:sensor histidine kinase [Streptomyces sp. NPDC006487]|uniref:sensor histidine kinase n=1 Tax=Streptomyces sp. NPDC006487 TaxID=3364748 RepID=UPI0036969365